ncbi:HsdM family class I SAM-dependent methyltransferase [Mesomycoplasma ovipneumoniae]|uniref:site-specific DNA-methyltransferase (adenine-specific) n=1 Tax=Mesomycoplasma ovipneumoniae 14811 TaxID=1188239 RepID=A0A014L5R7_9BACT|nr:N-6 DNA methylase [Mesomycoplasma ovipneumoniae]EXU60799.1 Type IIG restriction modification systemrestriction enzyme/N6-adenine DNA methyltransferase [Mesomycoplasma ovipneumoniae 14811]
MTKKEAMTNLWVYDMLKEAGLKDFTHAEGSNIKEINDALSTASKWETGYHGRPDYVAVVDDFLIVIENKARIDKHIKRDDRNLIASDTNSITKYAVNGALYYGKHLAEKTSYKKIIAIGVSGNEKNHKITPLFVDERGEYKELNDLATFISFNVDNIKEYYKKEILKIPTNNELKTEELLKVARDLHEDLRNYGNLQDNHKPLIVSGILLALSEIEHKNFDISDLNGDTIRTDGQKIYKAIEDNLKRADVRPEVKRDKLLNQFNIIRDNNKINEKDANLGKTPLRYFTETLHKEIFRNIKYNSSSEDYIGRFYGEFMSYSGGDGQSLGIILTPKHITELFCDLLDIKPTDKVLDPCCGTGGFLIAAMHKMLLKTEDEEERNKIRRDRLFGIELQDYMFAIATTNMILRGDGKSNLENQDFLKQNPSKIQVNKSCTIGMMNPPYSQGSNKNPDLYEINFVNRLLESMVIGAKIAVIVPQSTFTGKTRHEQDLKTKILKNHTLEGVITLNKDTFYGVGTNTCIGIFTAWTSHSKTKKVKFINFEDDGYIVRKHIGLMDDGSAKDKKQHLLDVWNDQIEAPTKFCVKTTIEDTDEWLHSFYYFNDEIPSNEDFEKTIADYLTFQVNMITHGRGYLFGLNREIKQEKKQALKIAKDGGKYV